MLLLIKNLLEPFCLLPGFLILLLVAGLICFCRRRIAFTLIALATLLLYLTSLTPIAVMLAKPLQHFSSPPSTTSAQAIVILSGGRYFHAPEYRGDTASPIELSRIRYGAYLYRQTHLPILVTGGLCGAKTQSEAEIMAKVLQQDYRIPARWIETKSEDTWENARFSAALLKKDHIKTILLVTDAIHMTRATFSFQQMGINVIPAPTNYITLPEVRSVLLYGTPQSGALLQNGFCWHEYIGLFFYRWLHHQQQHA